MDQPTEEPEVMLFTVPKHLELLSTTPALSEVVAAVAAEAVTVVEAETEAKVVKAVRVDRPYSEELTCLETLAISSTLLVHIVID